MRKLAIAATTAMITFAAAAQQPLQCLNPDILNGVIFFGSREEKVDVTRGLPSFMSGFSAPAGFSLIGTGVRGGGTMTTVAYKTLLPSDKAYAAVVAALGAEGWEVESLSGSAQTFNLANGPRNGTVCRNGERRSVLVADVAGARYVSIMVFPQQRPHDCNTPDPAMTAPFDVTRNAVPRFQFPAGTSLARGVSGGGGSSQTYTASSRIITAETPASLVGQLAGQLQAQQWRQDSDWSGAVSTGSTWRKIIDGQLTWGTLEIARVSEGTYDVDFTLAVP